MCGALTLLVDDGVLRPRVVVRAVLPPEASIRGGRRPSPSTRAADPHPQAPASERSGCCPTGECSGSGAMPPSVRKPSLAIRRGCLGVPHPPAAAPRLRVSVWPAKGAPPLRAARAPSDALRPTAARASPHRVGGGSRTGPGPASPARFCRPRCCGRVWRLNAPRGEVWGGAAPPPPPPASPRRAALRPLPSRAAAGGRRAGMGWGRLARGGSFPRGVGFRSCDRAAGERERQTPLGGSPRRREGRAGAPQWRGSGSGQARGRVPEAGRRPGRRGAALVCGGGIPVRFPGGPPVSSALPWESSVAPPAPLYSGAPVLREASSPLLPTRPFASGRLPRPASRRAGVAAVPTLGRAAAPHGGAPLGPDDAGVGGRARVRYGQGVRSAGSATAAVAGPELPREVRSLAGGDRSQSAPWVPRDRLRCPEGPRR